MNNEMNVSSMINPADTEQDKTESTSHMQDFMGIEDEQERNTMLHSLLNQIPGGVAVFKCTETFLCQYFSDGFAKISGRSREEINQLNEKEELLKTVIAPSDYQTFLDTVRERIALGLPINLTFRYMIKHGGIGWLHLAASKLREEDGCPVYYCIFTNPTDETSLYRSIVEDSANGVFVAERKTRNVLYMNDAICKIFNIPRQIVRKRIDDAENISQQYIFLTQEDVDTLKEEAFTEFHVVWKEKLYLAIHAKALSWNGRDAYIMYFTDETAEHNHQQQLQQMIDELVKTQHELQENRAMLNAALDSAKVMEWRYDFKNHVVTDSGAFGLNYHMPKVIENIPQVFLDAGEDGLICEESIDDFIWLFEHSGEGRRIQRDIHFKSPDRTRLIWKKVIYTPIFDSFGNCVESIGTAVDITEQKEREQEEKKKQALTLALRIAEESNRSKTEFLARMSHDMRTPMNGILGLAELSIYEEDVAVLRKNVAQIKESGDYLLSLINDTLDFQRIESGKMSLNNQVVYTKLIFQSALDLIRPAAKEKGVEFCIINRNVDMDWYVYIDPVRMKQILLNLLSNAVKFTPKGGRITLDIQNLSSNGYIFSNCIKVIDTGIGMSEEFLKNHLFQPFSQEQSEISTQYAGSGLGLSIAHSLVKMMGGRIEVESRQGKGTVFSVYLDFQRVEETKVKQVLEQKNSLQFTLEEQLVDKKLLLIEDHPLNAQIAQKILEKAGCRVVWEIDGAKGLQAFEQSEPWEYDAVLMDIRMPVMNGLEAAQAIRMLQREDAKTVPIIAMTANAYEEDVQKSLAVGMNAHLAKPIDPAKLYETLAQCL